jgi:hypothetical protein
MVGILLSFYAYDSECTKRIMGSKRRRNEIEEAAIAIAVTEKLFKLFPSFLDKKAKLVPVLSRRLLQLQRDVTAPSITALTLVESLASRVTRRLKRKSPNFWKCGLNISQNTNKLKI